MLYQQILAKNTHLEQQIQQIQAALLTYPEGTLLCTRNQKHIKWYHRENGTLTYIPKKNRRFAEQLAIKKYLRCALKDLASEQTAISHYLRHYHPTDSATDSLLEASSPYQELLAPYFTPKSKELDAWMHAAYERCPKHPEHLLHKTHSGYFVRSKSEVLIDTALYTHRLPFRYEAALALGESIIYPDFTIRHPEDGRLYYWEHFGKMDDPYYVKNVYSKLQLYTLHGIIPSIQLITTYETKEHPLNIELVEKIIKHYF